MEGNPLEKSKQQHEEIEAQRVPDNSPYYALDNHGNPVFGASAQHVKEKVLEANQGYA